MAFDATLDTLYRWADKVLRLDDTPPRLAAAFAWGVTAGFSPFFIVQYVVAFLVAVVFRLNKLLVLAGLCINLPWIMVPWYTATTAIAGALLGVPLRTTSAGSSSRCSISPSCRGASCGTSSAWSAPGCCRSLSARRLARSCWAWRPTRRPSS